MWATSAPDVPSGLQIACVTDGKTLEASRTCPVIRYQGSTTWIYSYKDNRTSLAVVSYDGDGKVIRNVEHAGARYVVGMTWDPKAQTVTITGEENRTITVPWSDRDIIWRERAGEPFPTLRQFQQFQNQAWFRAPKRKAPSSKKIGRVQFNFVMLKRCETVRINSSRNYNRSSICGTRNWTNQRRADRDAEDRTGPYGEVLAECRLLQLPVPGIAP